MNGSFDTSVGRREFYLVHKKSPLYHVTTLNLMQEAPNYHQPIKVKGKRFMNFHDLGRNLPPDFFFLIPEARKENLFMAV